MLLGLVVFHSGMAQLQDDFSDGDFTTNPVWTGDVAAFEVNAQNQLHLNSTGTDTSILVSPSAILHYGEWKFWVKQSFNSSSNNYSRVYVAANSANLAGSLNAYFIQIGNTADDISLWRQDGNYTVQLIAGSVANTGGTTNEFSIKLLCDSFGNFQLYTADASLNYALEGSAFDNTYTSSSYFGVFCKYTSSNATKFYFDQFEIGNIIIDTLPPQVLKVDILSSTALIVSFNEVVDLSSSEFQQNYTLIGFGNPVQASRLSSDSSKVMLTFANPFTYALQYDLEVKHIKDNAANMMSSVVFPFIWYNLTMGDVVINEIMADPSPTIGLPEAEYLEIYNQSPLTVNLKNWVLKIGGIAKVLADYDLSPSSFLIIGAAADEALLSPYGDFMGLSSFSLTNSGADLLLLNDSNRLMHRVNYKFSWYTNALKSDGGWSLEQIDPGNYCATTSNWIESISSSGGSPGEQNSVLAANPDTQLPSILRAVVPNAYHLDLFFDAFVDSSFALTPANYQITNGIGSPSYVSSHYPDYATYSLQLANPLLAGVIYELTISAGLSDCAGNITAAPLKVQFGLSEMPDSNDLVISEILFNPKADGVDYVEIYNQSDKLIDLKSLQTANWNASDELFENAKNISETGFQIFPKQYYVLTTSASWLQKQYFVEFPENIVETAELPTLNNTSGNLYLITKSLQFIDGMNYTEEMHYALLNNPEGVSLERIDLLQSALNTANWHSAAVPGRNADGFGGTPSYRNSQAANENAETSKWSLSNEIFSPDNDGYNDYLQLNYLFEQPGFMANVQIYDAKGLLINNLISNRMLETDGHLIWDGTDISRQKAPIGIYLVYIEYFDLSGHVHHKKLTAVLGAKF